MADYRCDVIDAEFGAFGDHPVEPLTLGDAASDDDPGGLAGFNRLDIFDGQLSGFAGGGRDGRNSKISFAVE